MTGDEKFRASLATCLGQPSKATPKILRMSEPKDRAVDSLRELLASMERELGVDLDQRVLGVGVHRQNTRFDPNTTPKPSKNRVPRSSPIKSSVSSGQPCVQFNIPDNEEHRHQPLSHMRGHYKNTSAVNVGPPSLPPTSHMRSKSMPKMTFATSGYNMNTRAQTYSRESEHGEPMPFPHVAPLAIRKLPNPPTRALPKPPTHVQDNVPQQQYVETRDVTTPTQVRYNARQQQYVETRQTTTSTRVQHNGPQYHHVEAIDPITRTRVHYNAPQHPHFEFETGQNTTPTQAHYNARQQPHVETQHSTTSSRVQYNAHQQSYVESAVDENEKFH
jgi:hypothetical protein